MTDKYGEELQIGDWVKITLGAASRNFGKIKKFQKDKITITGESVDWAIIDVPIAIANFSNSDCNPYRTSSEIEKLSQGQLMILILENGCE